MVDSPTVSSVAKELGSLKAGSRAWFWFCPELAEPHPPLLVKSFKSDAKMTALKAQAETLPTPLGATLCMGFASVGADGQMQFGSPALSWEMLGTLARWAARHAGEHPELSRLKNAAFLNVSPQGAILKKIEDEALWAELPDPGVPGTMAETVTNLGRLQPGRNFWFYMSSGGPAGGSFLTLGSSKRDTDASRFARKVAEVRRRFPSPEQTARGVLRALPSGGLVFTTRDDVSAAAGILASLLEQHPEELAPLQGARVIGMADGSFTATATAGGPSGSDSAAPALDLSSLSAALEGLSEGSEVPFWFTAQASNGTAMLLMGTDREAMKAAAKSAGGDGIRGRAVVSRKGWLEFRTRQAAPDFITALAGFAASNHSSWPALGRLKGARMTQRSSDGEILDRQKNDEAWAALS